MRPVKVCIFIGLMFAQIGCARPLTLTVDAPTLRPAEVSVRLVRGRDAATVPNRPCRVPCPIVIAPDAEYQLTLQAPGYYPASVGPLTYDQVMYLNQAFVARGSLRLVVPMEKRPASQEQVPSPE
jgi:hypothetical protein